MIARVLLPAGLEPLAERYDVHSGGLEAGRDELIAIAPGANALVADASVPVDAEVLDACGDGLRVVANFAVGYDNIDLPAAAARGVRIGNTPGVLTEAVAELAIGLVLAASRRIAEGDRFVRSHGYVAWAADAHAAFELRGRTIGIVGPGRIGTAVARIARDGFGMEIVYTGRSAKPELAARRLELDELLAEADVVVVTVPLSRETHHLIGARELALVKPGAVLVNVSRGPVVDEHALVEALRNGPLAAAGLDVYEFEPHPVPELLELENVVMTPHVASATGETRAAMARLAAENVLAALAGEAMPAEVHPS